MQTTLTSKGQMTLPSAARARLGLAAGDRLVVTIVDDDTIVLKRPPEASARSLRGLLPKPASKARSLDEMDAAVTEHLRTKHGARSR